MAQVISIQYFDPADAKEINERFQDIRPRGIYKGGYLSKVAPLNNTQVNLSELVVEIGDDDYQVKILTDAAETVTVSSGTPYVILRWAYAESPSNTMTITAVALGGDLQANDIIVGKCVYSGSILQDVFDYATRNIPLVQNRFLQCVPNVPADMKVRVYGGNVNYGVQNYKIDDQLTSDFVAPTVSTRYDVIYADIDGTIKVFEGTEGAGIPVLAGKTPLAMITLTVGMLTITASNITDYRAFLSGNGYAVYAP